MPNKRGPGDIARAKEEQRIKKLCTPYKGHKGSTNTNDGK